MLSAMISLQFTSRCQTTKAACDTICPCVSVVLKIKAAADSTKFLKEHVEALKRDTASMSISIRELTLAKDKYKKADSLGTLRFNESESKSEMALDRVGELNVRLKQSNDGIKWAAGSGLLLTFLTILITSKK